MHTVAGKITGSKDRKHVYDVAISFRYARHTIPCDQGLSAYFGSTAIHYLIGFIHRKVQTTNHIFLHLYLDFLMSDTVLF